MNLEWQPDIKFPEMYTITCLKCGDVFKMRPIETGGIHICKCGRKFYNDATCRIVVLVDNKIKPETSNYTVETTY